MKPLILGAYILFSLATLTCPKSFANFDAELQWVFCDKNLPDIISALGLPQPSKTEQEEIYYLETKDKDFVAHNIFIKFKKSDGKKISSSVKVRFSQLSDIPNSYKNKSHIVCEEDIYIDTARWACTIKGKRNDFGFSKEQIELLKENGIATTIFEKSFLLGPLAATANDVTEDIQFDVMQTPDGSVIGEFSVRSSVQRSQVQQAYWNAEIQKANLPLCNLQSGKRDVVLEGLWQSGAYESYLKSNLLSFSAAL
jgi:hypothetical protein